MHIYWTSHILFLHRDKIRPQIVEPFFLFLFCCWSYCVSTLSSSVLFFWPIPLSWVVLTPMLYCCESYSGTQSLSLAFIFAIFPPNSWFGMKAQIKFPRCLSDSAPSDLFCQQELCYLSIPLPLSAYSLGHHVLCFSFPKALPSWDVFITTCTKSLRW